MKLNYFFCFLSDNCLTREGSVIAEESQLHLIEILQRHLKKSHGHRPYIFGALLLMIPELRVLAHVLAYDLNLRLNQLIDIRDALPTVMKETLSPEGKAYELLSSEMIKRICEEVTENVRKRKKSVKYKKKKKQRNDLPRIENFIFFTPPSEQNSRANLAWSLRADIWCSTDEGEQGPANSSY